MAGDKSDKRARRFAFIYLVLGGLLAIATFIAQPGIYSGSLHGQIYIMDVDNLSYYSAVYLQAETKPAWYWRCPHNHMYQQVNMVCDNLGTDSQRAIKLDLNKGTWSSDGKQGNLDEKSLTNFLISGQDVNVADTKLSEQVQGLLTCLQQMHTGTFLPARHHSHSTKTPIKASYQHFTSGQDYGIFAVFAWLLVWPVYLIFVKQPPCPRWLTPRKAFLVTGGIVVALDLIFLGIHAVFSPGGVSEVVEFMGLFLNMPSWFILGDRDVFTPLGWVLGVVSWSVIMSVGVMFVTSPVRPALKE